jgi:hypothetical protein
VTACNIHDLAGAPHGKEGEHYGGDATEGIAGYTYSHSTGLGQECEQQCT